MATQHAIDEADIRRQIDKAVEAIRAMDLGGVMSMYAPDIVDFDIVLPLQHVGAEAKRKNWVEAFTVFQRPLGYEIRDLTITVGGDGFEHSDPIDERAALIFVAFRDWKDNDPPAKVSCDSIRTAREKRRGDRDAAPHRDPVPPRRTFIGVERLAHNRVDAVAPDK